MTDAVTHPRFPAQKGRRTRGRTWWAQRWVDDVEQAALDSDTLKRGRAYARGGLVGPLTFAPGLVSAEVHTDDESLHVRIRVDRLDERQWGEVLATLASRSGHVAQLSSGTLPRELDEDLAAVDVSLIPSMFDADATCTCEEWDVPCRHAAAVLYQAAWVLDDDPLLFFLLGGARDRRFCNAGTARTRRRPGRPSTMRASRCPRRMPTPQCPDRFRHRPAPAEARCGHAGSTTLPRMFGPTPCGLRSSLRFRDTETVSEVVRRPRHQAGCDHPGPGRRIRRADLDVVHEAPAPVVPRMERLDDRMTAAFRMVSRVPHR